MFCCFHTAVLNRNSDFAENLNGLLIDYWVHFVPWRFHVSSSGSVRRISFWNALLIICHIRADKIAGLACEIHARGYFSAVYAQGTRKQKGWSVLLCSLGDELSLIQLSPYRVSKQDKPKHDCYNGQTHPMHSSQKVLIHWLLFWHWNRCHQTVMKTTTPKCDTTSCRVLWHQFQLLNKWL